MFSVDNAIRSALCCQAIYAGPQGYGSAFAALGLDVLAASAPNIRGELDWVISRDAVKLRVTHQGTIDAAEWFQDAQAALTSNPLGDGKIHYGFKEHWWPQYAFILNVLKAQISKYPDSAVTVEGHSLGADGAIYNSLWLELGGIAVDECYAIEPARPGDARFWECYFERGPATHCVVNEGDPIPTLQLAWPFGYRHVNQLYFMRGITIKAVPNMPPQLVLHPDNHEIAAVLAKLQQVKVA